MHYNGRLPNRMKLPALRMCVFFLVVIPGIVLAQTTYTDRDSSEIYKLLNLADELDYEGRLDSALKIIEIALMNSHQRNFKRGQGFALLKKADLKVKKTEYEEVQQLLNDGFILGLSLQDSLMMGLSHHQRSQYFRTTNEYPKAIESLHAALNFYSKTRDSLYIGICYVDLGYSTDKLGQYVMSSDHYLKALRIFEALGDEKETANTLVNLAICHYRLNDKQTCVKVFKEALSIQEKIGDVKRISATLGNLVSVYSQLMPDSALHYQHRALEYAKKVGTKNALAQAYSNTGNLLAKQKKYSEAVEMYLKAKVLNEEIGDLGKLFTNLISCAELSDKMNDSVRAESYYTDAYDIASRQQSKPLLQTYYQLKSGFYKTHNNFTEAFSHLTKNYLYRDSMINEKTKSEISELNLKYETEKKELLLVKLAAEQKQKLAEIDRQNQIIRVSKLLNLQRENEIIILEKDQELKDARLTEVTAERDKQELINHNNEQEIKILEQDRLLREKEIRRKNDLIQLGMVAIIISALLAYLLFTRYKLKKKVAEQSALITLRNNIARDLHDEIGSTLTSINILSKVSSQNFEQAPQQSKLMIDQIKEQSQTIQQNMSDIVWAIRSDTELLEALSSRMSEYAAKTLETQGIHVNFNVDDSLLNRSLSIESRKDVLLIFKEVINNIVKHAGATVVDVNWQKKANGFELSIRDNGLWKGTSNTTGTGMKSILHRAEQIGGRIDIHKVSTGTEVLLYIPFA